MSFLNPAALWSLAALLIPLAIHFWHRKKGRLVRWAAMQWLPEHTSLASRGLQLDDVPLLLIRLLLVTFFVLLLARPVFDFIQKKKDGRTVHLAQRDKFLVENYRFELERARQKGEMGYWIDGVARKIGDLKTEETRGSVDGLQSAIASVMHPGDSLELYLRKETALLALPQILVPGPYKIHWLEPALKEKNHVNGFELTDGSVLAPGGNDGLLKVFEKATAGMNVAHTGPVRIRVDYRDSVSVATLKAALLALQEVCHFPFVWVDHRGEEDILFTDQPVRGVVASRLYFLPEAGQVSANVFRLELPLTAQSSSLVSEGRLPEWLGERILGHYGLENVLPRVAQSQLEARFKGIVINGKSASAASLNPWLLAVLLVLVCLERYYVLHRKTASDG